MHLSLFNIFSDYNTCTCGLSVCSLCLSPLLSTEWDVSGSEGFVDLGLHPGFPHYAGAQIGWKGNSFHSFISNLHLVSIQWHIPPNNLNIFSLSSLQVQWNWFLIFLPVWVFDGILILMLAIKMAGRCKPGYDPRNGSPDLRLRSWYLTAMLLKLGFCLTLCAKLERLADVKLTFVCIPLWTMLMGALVELGLNIFPERREA